ncbi:hypothetical protein SVIOM74S_02755 [Streptomyces violarus]
MTEGAGQGPEVERTATLRDFRVPAYVHEAGPYVHSAHPGEVAPPPGQTYPEGYTPTERDLPVINRGDTVQVTVDPEAAAAPQADTGQGPLYVVGDVHGSSTSWSPRCRRRASSTPPAPRARPPPGFGSSPSFTDRDVRTSIGMHAEPGDRGSRAEVPPSWRAAAGKVLVVATPVLLLLGAEGEVELVNSHRQLETARRTARLSRRPGCSTDVH